LRRGLEAGRLETEAEEVEAGGEAEEVETPRHRTRFLFPP